MKLVIGGATGYVGSEILRQALASNQITSIVSVGRRPASAPSGTDASKLENIVAKDLTQYSDADKKKLADAGACIWTIAVTPNKTKGLEWEEIKKASSEYAVVALKTIVEARNGGGGESKKKPLRFIYFSGALSERDQSKKPFVMAQYALMRGDAENRVLQYAKESQGAAEVGVVKPGFIMSPNVWGRGVLNSMGSVTGLPALKVEECAAAPLKMAIEGIEKETLENDEMKRVGAAWLKGE